MPEPGSISIRPASSTHRFLRLLLWLVALGLFYVTLRSVSWPEAWRAIGRLEPSQIAMLLGLNVLALGIFGARWWWILRGLGHELGFVRVASYRLASFGVAYFTPGPQVGGEPVQVLLLERCHGISRAHAIASVALDKVLEASVNFGFLAGAAALLLSSRQLPAPEAALAFVVVLLLLPLGYLVALWFGVQPVTFLSRPLGRLTGERFLEVLQTSETEAHRFCRERTGYLALAMLVSLGSWIVILAEYWLMARFLGIALSFRQLVVGLTAARIAYLMFFPAGLGVFEAGQVLALRSLGFAPALGLSLSLVIRVRDVLLGAIGIWWGYRRLRETQRPDPTPEPDSTGGP